MATAAATLPPVRPFRWAFDLYERLGEHALILPSDHVHLEDGLLVQRPPRSPAHGTAVARGVDALRDATPRGWHYRVHCPIALLEGPTGFDSAPEPDLAVAVGDLNHYAERHPTGAEIGLVLTIAASAEVARIDRATLHRYAFANIPTVGIVNLPERVIEVHTDPTGPTADPGYRTKVTLGADQTFACSLERPGTGPALLAPIPVAAFFPPVAPPDQPA